MAQAELFHETFTDALKEIIDTLGGAKKVGHLMRPEKTVDAAGRWVLDCLNVDRDHRFDPEQVLWLLREGRRIGCHAGARFLLREAGYAEPVPLDPADQKQKLAETIKDATEQLKNAFLILERIDKNDISRVVPRAAA